MSGFEDVGARMTGWAEAQNVEDLVTLATQWLVEATGAAWAAAYDVEGTTPELLGATGDVPAEPELGTAVRLARGSIALAVGSPAPDWRSRVLRDLVVLDACVTRLVLDQRLADLTLRMDNAQQLANMGDYDWQIATDTNKWSDQLYRIYGHEPGSFNASYERFLGMIHPDDRERVQGIHQAAYASGEPYQMVERIVRPDGELRYLSSNGQVIMDPETGVPVRMRGTCVDITEQVHAQEVAQRSSERFRDLVEHSPDAIVVYDAEHTILHANDGASALLGGDPVGSVISTIVDVTRRSAHGVDAIGLDGSPKILDVTVARLGGGDHLSAAFLRDAAARIQRESIAAQLREAQLRRRQALELNDSVVQGLTASALAMQAGDLEVCKDFLTETLAAARRMMNDWLNPLEGTEVRPGDLVRSKPSTFANPERDAVVLHMPQARRITDPRPRVLIAEDNDDLRELMRAMVENGGTYDVVGEAHDGEEAVALARELLPDVVLLDLSMPRMDGLTALPLILAGAPKARVVVVSGFDRDGMSRQAIAAGAALYVEKGVRMDLAAAVGQALNGSSHLTA